MISYECRHIMPSGAKCQAPSLKGKPYCYAHTRLHQFKAKPKVGVMDDFFLPVIEDRHSVLMALAMVNNALCANRIDGKHAGRLLYSIQIAAQMINQKGEIIPFQPVESMTETETGEELGPEKVFCDLDKCAICPDHDTCEFSGWDEDDEGEPKPSTPTPESTLRKLSTAARRAVATERRSIINVNNGLPILQAVMSNGRHPLRN
jgi:hypothetical protein